MAQHSKHSNQVKLDNFNKARLLYSNNKTKPRSSGKDDFGLALFDAIVFLSASSFSRLQVVPGGPWRPSSPYMQRKLRTSAFNCCRVFPLQPYESQLKDHQQKDLIFQDFMQITTKIIQDLIFFPMYKKCTLGPCPLRDIPNSLD